MSEGLVKTVTCNKCGTSVTVDGRHASVTRPKDWSTVYGGGIQDTDLCPVCSGVLKEWLTS